MVYKSVVALSLMLFSLNTMGANNSSSSAANEDNLIINYNPSFLQGGPADLSGYTTGNPVPEGVYLVTIIINDIIKGKHDITFKAGNNVYKADPCFNLKQLNQLGVIADNQIGDKVPSSSSDDGGCYPITKFVKFGSVSYNSADLELNLSVPQLNSPKVPDGYIDPSRWDDGVTALFIDYNFNNYISRRNSSKFDYNANLNWNAGFNYEGWRLRHRSNSSWSEEDKFENDSLLTYLETDVTALKSTLTLGDAYTSGDIFEPYSLRGLKLGSNRKMLPESLNNYKPVLSGIADTNARVQIRQNGSIIYETTVPPGPFELTDFSAMAFGGNLELVIIEADGRQKIQDIVFSAPPMLLHPGVSLYSIVMGELKDSVIKNTPKIIQGEYQYGVNNFLSIYTGFQLAEYYRSIAIGNAYNTPIGGVGFDITHARSDLGDKVESGNSFRVNFTKLFSPTNTNISVVANRYSSKGFYSFNESTLWRNNSDIGLKNSSFWQNNVLPAVNFLTNRTKNELSANISQTLWAGSYLRLAGSYFTFWDARPSAIQMSVTYSQPLKYFTYSLSYQRTKMPNDKYDNAFMINFSVPLGSDNNSKPIFDNLSIAASRDDSNRTGVQQFASGSRGKQNELNYSVGTTINSDDDRTDETISGSMNYRTPIGSIGSTASMSNDSNRQLSLSANGSIVAHPGGVTLGPSLNGSAFAIIEADGAWGSEVMNGYGAKVNRWGHAIVPNLTEYRENRVGLEPTDLSINVDVIQDQAVIVPRKDSAIAVKMVTIVGAPVVLIVKGSDGKFIPIGTNLYGQDGKSVAIIGQSGMAFVRGWDGRNGPLRAAWNSNEQCQIQPDDSLANKISSNANSIVQLEVQCI